MTENRIHYSAVAVPYEPDYDGEILSPSEIKYAAHSYLRDYRIVDPEHVCALGKCKEVANPVESYITNEPMSVKGYDGSTIDLPAGTWVVGVEVFDDTTLEQILNGEKRGVSLTAKRGADVTKSRVLIRDLGENWEARTVSIVRDPAVPKARFFINDDRDIMSENIEDQTTESGIDKIVSAIKSLKRDDVLEDPQDVEDVEIAAEDQQEDVVEESVKSVEDVADDPVVEDAAEDLEVNYVTQEELAATKSELLEVIKSLKPQKDAADQERIVELEKEINDLKNRRTSVKSKAIPDHYQEPAEVTKGYDDDRDLYGRVIRR